MHFSCTLKGIITIGVSFFEADLLTVIGFQEIDIHFSILLINDHVKDLVQFKH